MSIFIERSGRIRSSPIKVALVDNDPQCLDVYGRYLESEKMRVERIDGSFGVTNRVLVFAPDVVVLDVEMPAARGDQFAKVLRHWVAVNDASMPRLLMFSAVDEARLKSVAALASADSYLSKSAGVAALAAEVRRLANLRG